MNELSQQIPSVSNPARRGRIARGVFVLVILAVALSNAPTTEAAPARPLRGVRTLYDLGGRGNAYFNSQLRREIRASGLHFTRDRRAADATFASRGDGTQGGGFAGSITFRDQRGRLLWSKSVVRPASSRTMAFRSLAHELRAAQ